MTPDCERPEVEAFLLGFGLAMRAVGKFVSASSSMDKELFDQAYAVAREIYPDYEPIRKPPDIHIIRTMR